MAIETEYAGHLFRSRLEARWAVFFDQLGIRWQYEAQGYEFAGYRYLPDFLLPDDRCYVEVKGDADKLEDDVPRLQAFTQELRTGLLVLGDISTPTKDRAPVHFRYNLGRGCLALVAQRPCGERRLRYGVVSLLVPHKEFIRPRYLYGIQSGPEITAAYRTARTARFEFGETPQSPGQ